MNNSWSFDELLTILARLRAPGGCPWDIEQDHQTLKPYLLEESYEVLEAIDSGSPRHLAEELGDLLLQIVFHAQVASEQGHFHMGDVITSICEKLIRRHPHVFADAKAEDADAVARQWRRIKAVEKGEIPEKTSALAGVGKSLPALQRAQRLQERAARVGFDWENVSGVLDKIAEEARELSEAIRERDEKQQKDEAGDLLFALVNLCRFLKVEAEDALRISNRRFEMRFCYIEETLGTRDRKMAGASLEELDRLWDEAKEKLAGRD